MNMIPVPIKLHLTDSAQGAYTCPADTIEIVEMVHIANRATDGSDVGIDLWWTDASDGDDVVYLERGTTIIEGDAGIVARSVTLNAGDTLRAQATVSGLADLTGTVYEMPEPA